MTDFPALRRVARLLAWMIVFGGAVIVLGLVLGIFMGVWSGASAALGAGAFAIAGGIYGRHRTFQMMEQLRKRG